MQGLVAVAIGQKTDNLLLFIFICLRILQLQDLNNLNYQTVECPVLR